MKSASLMHDEALEAPTRIQAMIEQGFLARRDVATTLLRAPPSVALTVGRGSSDHVCAFAAWSFARWLGLPTMSLPPSLITRDGAELKVGNSLLLAVSQSGQGADVVEVTEWATRAGARTVALVNDVGSPLANAAEFVLDQQAGKERSVAATKSVLCSMAVIQAILTDVAQVPALHAALAALPRDLTVAAGASSNVPVDDLASAQQCFVLGRGAGLSAASEIALKLKETCGLPAEALSGAEVRHGPREVVGPCFLVIALAIPGPTEADVRMAAFELAGQGAKVIMIGTNAADLWRLPPVDQVNAPLAALQLAYPAIARAAALRGHDPDRPQTLSKVTSTR